MALTAMTFSPASINEGMTRDAPPKMRLKSITVTGDDAFTGATLSEPAGACGWLLYPATCDKDVAFDLRFDFKHLRGIGDMTTTLRVTSGAVTADLPITITPRPGGPPK